MKISTYIRASLAALAFGLVIVFFGAQMAHAATASSEAERARLIESLMAQLRELQALTDGHAVTETSKIDACMVVQNNVGFGFGMNDASVNGDVTRVQKFLKEQGYLSASPSGYFGVLTTQAVQKFQATYGIEISGYVGQPTYEKMNEIACGKEIKKNTTKKVTDTSSSKLWKVRNMTGEQRGDDYRVTISGNNLNLVKRIEYSGKMLTGEKGRIVTKKNGKITFEIDASDLAPQYSGDVTFLLYDKAGNEDEIGLYINYKEEPQIASASLYPTRFGRDGSTDMELEYEIVGVTDDFALWVEPVISCPTEYSALCARYQFSLGMKAAETYDDERVDPYVKGGASFSFTPQSGTIFVSAEFDPDYVDDLDYTPIFPTIRYNLRLVDKITGEELDSQVLKFHWKG